MVRSIFIVSYAKIELQISSLLEKKNRDESPLHQMKVVKLFRNTEVKVVYLCKPN